MDNIYKRCDLLFLLISTTMVFNGIPQKIQLTFIGGDIFGSKLMIYPLIIWWGYTLYQVWRGNLHFIEMKKFLIFIVVYIGFVSVSFVVGGINYYHLWGVSGINNVNEKFKIIADWLHLLNVNIDDKKLYLILFFAKTFKGFLLETFYTWGSTFLVYIWYVNRKEKGVYIFLKGTGFGIVLFVLYACMDVFYLAGNSWAKEALEILNPYIHYIDTLSGWWPPLLWEGQLRSLFLEPSHVGNFVAVALPAIFFKIVTSHKGYKYYVTLFLISFFVYLSQSRTAYFMYLFSLFIWWGMVFVARINNTIKAALISCAVIIISIFCGSFFIHDIQSSTNHSNLKIDNSFNIQVNGDIKNDLTNDISNNLGSLKNEKSRSNAARYALIKSSWRGFKNHYVMGVGYGLSTNHIVEQFTSDERNVWEVKNWIYSLQKDGITKVSLNSLTEYVTKLEETGVIGLVIFFIPIIYLLFKLSRELCMKNNERNERAIIIFLLVTIVSELLSGMNLSLNIYNAVWFFLGLGYCYINKLNEN